MEPIRRVVLILILILILILNLIASQFPAYTFMLGEGHYRGLRVADYMEGSSHNWDRLHIRSPEILLCMILLV